jgi:hypothetical protein
MNKAQELWWQQAQSDFAAFGLLRRAAPCHQLHYLQMVTEKLAKAYLWRSNSPPPTVHAGFVQFLRSIAGSREPKHQQIATILGFGRSEDFQSWIQSILPLAYDLERLAPAPLNSPNPEYPWPHEMPQFAPATHEFEIWKQLTGTGRGRQFMQVIETAVKHFPAYA